MNSEDQQAESQNHTKVPFITQQPGYIYNAVIQNCIKNECDLLSSYSAEHMEVV